ncbi:MAG: hypothetical protein QXQ37_04130 [Nitrososphaerota archaeon]
MGPNVAKLIAISNEIFKRYNDSLEKQAQYENLVDEYGARIVKKLVENEIIEEDQADEVLATMKKSAAAPLKLLETVVTAIDSMNVKLGSSRSSTTIGYPYSQQTNSLVRKYSDINPSYVEDFVIDISQLR